MAKKKGTKKKKKGASSKKAANAGPTEPIIPKVCGNCGALYTPVKDAAECALCIQAKGTAQLFSALSASLANGGASAADANGLEPLKEDNGTDAPTTNKTGADGATGTEEKAKTKKKKKKAGSIKKKKSSLGGTKKKQKGKK